jgi:hypothetical protein
MAGSYRTIKATWGPIALQAQLQRQQGDQQQLASATAAAAAAGASVSGSSGAVAAAAAAGGVQLAPGCLDAVGLQEVVLAAVGFVEAQATARAGGASAQVRVAQRLTRLVLCCTSAKFAMPAVWLQTLAFASCTACSACDELRCHLCSAANSNL